jgi:hypothetical protein
MTEHRLLNRSDNTIAFHPFSFKNTKTGSINRIYGRGPKTLLPTHIEEFFKYESSSRTFKILGTKTLTGTTDAISVDPAKLKKLMSGG